jgi:hypothetical protein
VSKSSYGKPTRGNARKATAKAKQPKRSRKRRQPRTNDGKQHQVKTRVDESIKREPAAASKSEGNNGSGTCD